VQRWALVSVSVDVVGCRCVVSEGLAPTVLPVLEISFVLSERLQCASWSGEKSRGDEHHLDGVGVQVDLPVHAVALDTDLDDVGYGVSPPLA
jgi:hypothetical protein